MSRLKPGLLTSKERREYLDLLERRQKRTIKASFLDYAEHALEPLDQAPAAHHRLLISKLQAVADGKIKRLMVNMPPGSAKSTYGSVLFPAWLLGHRPDVQIIGSANTAMLAESFSRRVMQTVRDTGDVLGVQLGRESVELWDTTGRGQYRSVGIGGALTGFRGDIAILDDPVRSRQEADSLVVRETQWDWFNSVLRTRLKPGGAIVIIMTRWHEDDIGGRLLQAQPGMWDVVSIPAIAEDGDALGRAPGEWLWGDDAYDYAGELRKVYAEYTASGAMRDWDALFQQHPRPAEGSLFKTAMISVIPAAPVGGQIVRAWDLAATKAIGTRDPDWTVGVKLQRTQAGAYVVQDVVRLRGGPDEVEAAIVNTAHQDGPSVRISLPQDPGQAGKSQALYLTRKLAGFRVEATPETGDKTTRAAPVASQCNVGNMSIVQAAWNRSFLDELAGFPSATHDDQVDALSRAFSVVGVAAPPMLFSADILKGI